MKQHPKPSATIMMAILFVLGFAAYMLLPKPVTFGQYMAAMTVVTIVWVAWVGMVMRQT